MLIWLKTYKKTKLEALRWGHSLHEAVAHRIADGTELPSTMTRHSKWPNTLRAMKERGVDVQVELQLAMNKEFQPTAWFGNETWFRGIVDVLAIDDKYATAIDWKTGGKIQPDMEQLALNAQLIFAHYDIGTVHTAYHWTQHGEETINTYRRTDMVALWSRLLPEVKRMEEASVTLSYPPKPSGLCVRHCPVKSCQYHGKGSR